MEHAASIKAIVPVATEFEIEQRHPNQDWNSRFVKFVSAGINPLLADSLSKMVNIDWTKRMASCMS
jgi:hypothetical protein